MVVFQALTWEARDDDETQRHVVSIIGKTAEGRSVCVSTNYDPYFFLKLPAGATARDALETFQAIERACPEDTEMESYTVVHATDVWGFSNMERVPFLRLNFKNLESRKAAVRVLRYQRLELAAGVRDAQIYESNIDPVLRLMHETGIEATGWLDTGDECEEDTRALVDIDVWCDDWRSLAPVSRDDVAPFVVASFDIECYSSTGKFPNPEVADDACFQIAISLCRFGSDEPYKKTCLCFKTTDANLEGVEIASFDTERDLLYAFKRFLHDESVDIMTGWNIFGFDLAFIHERAIRHCDVDFFELGRLRDDLCHIVKKKLSSSALGDNELKLLPMSGRFTFDMFHEVKKNYKLDSYKLDAVSRKYLDGDSKIDMPPREMFRRYEREDPVELREIAEYCVKDTLLPQKLMKKLCTLLNLWEMAKATWVPLSFLTERGQQIKVYSLLTKKARELNFMVPFLKYGAAPEGGYVGATVLDAQKGAYYSPITALDFASLYPSIMMAHNLCYSTLVDPDGKGDTRYANLKDVTYETFQVGDKKYTFAQDVPSLVPLILDDLKKYRKKAKRDMAAATGFMKEVFNGKQLAFKISMNSIYGFTGASRGILPCMAIASTTTARGREMIDETKTYVEENFPGARVRYGDTDSVMIEFDVGNRTAQEAIDYSWSLGERAAAECTALFKKPNDLELEKVYYPFLLYSKKRYAAKLWEKNKKNDRVEFQYVDVKGLQLVRRDNTPHVREVLKELLDVVLESSESGPAIDLARDRAIELLTGDVSMEKLTLSQSLSDSYKVKGAPVSITAYDKENQRYLSADINMAHVQVMHKMRERKPGSEPQSGDRVPYVLVKTDDPNAKAFEKAEDPAWARENSIAIDYWYYFRQKFAQPVSDLLAPLIEGDDAKDAIFGEILGRYMPKKSKFPPQKLKITDFFTRNVDKKYTTV